MKFTLCTSCLGTLFWSLIFALWSYWSRYGPELYRRLPKRHDCPIQDKFWIGILIIGFGKCPITPIAFNVHIFISNGEARCRWFNSSTFRILFYWIKVNMSINMFLFRQTNLEVPRFLPFQTHKHITQPQRRNPLPRPAALKKTLWKTVEKVTMFQETLRLSSHSRRCTSQKTSLIGFLRCGQ